MNIHANIAFVHHMGNTDGFQPPMDFIIGLPWYTSDVVTAKLTLYKHSLDGVIVT